jgi:dipeptidyl aminopeptidase/acylaminoacyl peptidase
VSCPVLVLQGLEDKVVPPNQAEALVSALAANGIPHAYRAFEGEGHGFRGEAALRATMEAQLGFLGAVFGFEPADEPVMALPGIDAWRARRATAVAG